MSSAMQMAVRARLESPKPAARPASAKLELTEAIINGVGMLPGTDMARDRAGLLRLQALHDAEPLSHRDQPQALMSLLQSA